MLPRVVLPRPPRKRSDPVNAYESGSCDRLGGMTGLQTVVVGSRRLRAPLALLEAGLEAAQRRIAELELALVAAQGRNAQLAEENATLRERLDQNSGNSSRPPSSDQPGQRPQGTQLPDSGSPVNAYHRLTWRRPLPRLRIRHPVRARYRATADMRVLLAVRQAVDTVSVGGGTCRW